MASDPETPQLPPHPPSLIELLMNSRNRNLSPLSPVALGFTAATADDDDEARRSTRDRIILINPSTQGTVVIEGSSANLNSLLRDLLRKGGEPPASKASIESLPSVVIGESESGECAICLDEWLEDEVVKEMPCKHRFHGNCVEKWLKIHGTCPVCRYKMDKDEDDDLRKGLGLGFGGGDGRREIWVSFSVNRERRSENSDSDADSDENSAAMEFAESIINSI